ncbi:MAG: DNA-3-methyladenine glycosylase [Acidobacteriaceae bacterium]|nr:DNA-3-methyladenine glycosylase [Acidobacteriaceae bacterium]
MNHSVGTQKHLAKKNVIRRLRRAELPSDTIELARFLIGKVVVHELTVGRVSGRIVETEAYPPGDPAGHHFRGPTPRIRSMYLEPGHAYVFFNYGAHFMLNVSGEPAGTAGGILIRAVEPLEGIELMKKHRDCSDLLGLTRGPGRLAAAFQINRSHDGIDLCAENKLWLGVITGDGAQSDAQRVIGETVRIGISQAADHVLRFYEAGNPFVSGPKRLLGPAVTVRSKKIESSAIKGKTRARSKRDSAATRTGALVATKARKGVVKRATPLRSE